MRRCLLLVLVFLLTLSVQAFAASASQGPIIVAAEIPSGLTLELTIIDQLSGAAVPSLDFGDLVRVGDEFRSSKFFKVFLKVNSVGDSFELTQNGTALTRAGGAETLPSGAYIVKPIYEAADNNGTAQPSGAAIGNTGTAVGNKILYTDPTGTGGVVTLTYTLSGDPNTGATEKILLNQKSGAYAGTVQFTLTTA